MLDFGHAPVFQVLPCTKCILKHSDPSSTTQAMMVNCASIYVII